MSWVSRLRQRLAPAREDPMVMGGETEYAIGVTWAGEPICQEVLLRRIQQHSFRALGYTSTSARGRFLSNGGLLYLDGGLHMEWSTPECTSPFDVVRYLAAGDRIMYDVLTSFQDANPDVTSVFCSRACVDYLSKAIWAAHESYQYSRTMPGLSAEMLSFLASRVIFGAGGWNTESPALGFTLSPRAHFITTDVDRDSQYVRPLFHSKDEALAKGAHRLHVVCAESLCSQTGNVLRFGTTALVLALLERGVTFRAGVTLDAPVHALKRFATDPTLTATAQLARGGRASALDVQRSYLDVVTRHVGTLRWPWAAEVCQLWADTLDRLEADPASAASFLDWGIKRRVFERCLTRHGLTWQDLTDWERLLSMLRRRWRQLGAVGCVLTTARAKVALAALDEPMKELQRTLDARGLSWDGLDAVVQARLELFELDAKFGAMGGDGLFDVLDASGALDHRVMEVDVARLVAHPPQDTRARLRGEVVRRLTDANTRYSAEWTRVYDRDHNRMLDLMDPLEQEERWHEHVFDSGPVFRGA